MCVSMCKNVENQKKKQTKRPYWKLKLSTLQGFIISTLCYTVT